MTLPDLVAALNARGVRLSLRLVADAPAGALRREAEAERRRAREALGRPAPPPHRDGSKHA
jgi:hypothetical protein